jgi:ATP-dependent Lon protease
METFEQKSLDSFNEIVINKSLVHSAGFGSRSLPIYVREWIISYYLGGEAELNPDSREKIAKFIANFLPDKSKREVIKNTLFEQVGVSLLDNYSVTVNLTNGTRNLSIPYLDENHAYTTPQIIQENQMLLSSGLWGVGNLYYIPKGDDNPVGQVWMSEFKPFQLANVDLEYFAESRKNFTTAEWIDFLVTSMGFNFQLYTERQKVLLISRLIPMVEPRFNLIELAPKGTGKSFVYENMSRYVTVRTGAITPATLFFDNSKRAPGLITRFDSVVIDEAQKVRGDSSGELTALLKSYLESGQFARGSAGQIPAEAGMVILANIDLNHKKLPVNNDLGLFRVFPNFLRETAFIDRFSGLLPGWHLPRINKNTPARSIGLKGDIFGEILHLLRADISYRDYVKLSMELENGDDMRDRKAIEAGTTGLLKILFPDKKPTEQEFYKFCVNPAVELRQRVRDELCKLDSEFEPLSIRSKYPDQFQLTHVLPRYIDEHEAGISSVFFTSASTLEEEGQAEQQNNLTAIENLPDPQPDDQVATELDTFSVADAPALRPKTVNIKEGDAGYSYANLFGPYLEGATKVFLVDPYIRMDYQVRNLLSFASLLGNRPTEVNLHLVTSSEDDYQEKATALKLKEVAGELSKLNIKFTFAFDPSIHDRSIRLDNGWSIYPGRGLDIYQKSESKFDIGAMDETKRACRQTDIIYYKAV